MVQFELFEKTADQLFAAWIESPAGRHILDAFQREALRMRRRGFRRYSAQAIIERLRWEHDLKHGPDADGFKINHNWRRLLAKRAIATTPELEGFFQFRAPDANKPRRAVVVPLRKGPRA